jgi:hypothetical protein
MGQSMVRTKHICGCARIARFLDRCERTTARMLVAGEIPGGFKLADGKWMLDVAEFAKVARVKPEPAE